MTIKELVEQCCDSMAHPERSLSHAPAIVLKSPRRGGLFPKGGGPRGKVLGSERHNGQNVYLIWYDCMDVLKALCRSGKVRYSSDGNTVAFEIIA